MKVSWALLQTGECQPDWVDVEYQEAYMKMLATYFFMRPQGRCDGHEDKWDILSRQWNQRRTDQIEDYLQRLAQLQRENHVITHGSCTPVPHKFPDIEMFIREYQGNKWLVVLSCSDEMKKISLPEKICIIGGKNVICNYGINFGDNFGPQETQTIVCAPYEALVLAI